MSPSNNGNPGAVTATTPQGQPGPSQQQQSPRLPDTQTVNTPVHEAEVLAEAWGAIQQALDYFLSHPPTDTRAWFDTTRYISTYTLIYKYCVAPRIAPGDNPAFFHGERLYRRLEGYLQERFAVLLQELLNTGDLLACYLTAWERCALLARHSEGLFMYIERHWVERNLDNNGGRGRSSSRGGPQALRIKQLVFSKWNELVLGHVMGKLMGMVKERMSMERENHSLDFSLSIQQLLSAFATISTDIPSLLSGKNEPSLVKVFNEVVEPVYLQLLEGHLKADRIASLDQIRAVWDEEVARASFYLPDKSHNRVKECLKEELFVPNMELISREFERALSDNDDRCTAIMGLLELRPALLSRLDEVFGRFMTTKLSEIPDRSAEEFVPAILALHRWSSQVIADKLKGRAGMQSHRDTAFRSFLAQHRGGKVSELLAGQADYLLRNPAVSDQEFLSKLSELLAVFRLMDDKEIFKLHYSRFLSERLLLYPLSQSIEREKKVIDDLKDICGAGFTASLQRMLLDIQSSQELTAKFCNKTGVHIGNGHFRVLTTGSWNVGSSGLQTTAFPSSMQPMADAFKEFFVGGNKKKKIEWLPNYSIVEMSGDYASGRNVTILMTAAQYALLAPLLESPGYQTPDTLARNLGVPIDAVSSELDRVTRSTQFLIAKSGTGSKIGYAVNPDFAPTSNQVSLFGTAETLGAKETVDSIALFPGEYGQKTEEDRKFILQAAVIKTAKASRSIQIPQLIDQVKKRVEQWLPSYRTEEVMAVVEWCIEREYLKRAKSPDTLEYLP